MQSGSLKLFSNVEQKPMLLKRQAFAMFSGELDQYHLYLPLIQGALMFSHISVKTRAAAQEEDGFTTDRVD